MVVERAREREKGLINAHAYASGAMPYLGSRVKSGKISCQVSKKKTAKFCRESS